MRLILSELKIPLSGAAGALVAGLLLGGAMQPHLYDGDRPSGPQIFAEVAGARSTGPFDPGASFVSDPGKTPDYVMGTDWKTRAAWPDERAAVSASREVSRDDDSPSVEIATLDHAAYVEPPAPRPGYPSLGGARPAGDHAVDDDTVADAPATQP
jgi:hypothetical protein